MAQLLLRDAEVHRANMARRIHFLQVMRRRWYFVATTGCLLVGAIHVQAQTATGSMELTLVGTLGGPAENIVIARGFGFIGNGTRLISVALENPEVPSQVGATPLPAPVEMMVAHDAYVYAVLENDTVTIVDVADPHHPSVISSTHFEDVRGIVDLAVSNGLLYIGSQYLGVSVFDVRDPASPTEMYRKIGAEMGVQSFAVSDSYVYIVPGSELGFKVWQIASTGPSIVGEVLDPRGVRDIAVNDDMIYVIDRFRGLTIFDNEDPSTPNEVSLLVVRPGANDHFAVGDGRVYVASSEVGPRHSGGIVIIDVTIPSAPKEISELPIPSAPSILGRLTVSNSFVYEAKSGALRIIDVTDLRNPILRGTMEMLEYSSDLEVDGSHVYLAGSDAGFKSIDVSDVTRPTEIGSLDHLRGDHMLRYQNYVYLISGLLVSRIYVVNMENRNRPVVVGAISLSGEITCAEIDEGRLILNVVTSDIGSGSAHLVVFSLDHPDQPSIDLEVDEAGTFDVSWPYVYVGRNDMIKALDMNRGGTVVSTFTMSSSERITTIRFNDDELYVLQDSKLSMITVDEQTQLMEGWSFPLDSDARSMTVDDAFAYVGFSFRPQGRLLVISTRDEPRVVAHYDMTVLKVHSFEKHIFVAGEPALAILRKPEVGVVMKEKVFLPQAYKL